jgi:hypothetical protein
MGRGRIKDRTEEQFSAITCARLRGIPGFIYLGWNTYFDQSSSIPQGLKFKSHFGDVNAGLWYIKYECNRYTSPARPLSSSNSMTLASNDPSWWPIINVNIIISYFIGSWRVSCMVTMIDIHYHFAVAGFVGVMYDWSEQDQVLWRDHWHP